MLAGKMFRMTSVAVIFFMGYLVLDHIGLANETAHWQAVSDFALGLTLSALVLNLLYMSGILDKIREANMSRKAKNK